MDGRDWGRGQRLPWSIWAQNALSSVLLPAAEFGFCSSGQVPIWHKDLDPILSLALSYPI
jgi:hypothetical protein